MGKWHTIHRLSEIIEQIKLDKSLYEIYNDDIMSDNTITHFEKWWYNLRKRIQQYFNEDVRSFIPLWTKNNKNVLKYYLKSKISIMEITQQKVNDLVSKFGDKDYATLLLNLGVFLGENSNKKYTDNEIKTYFVQALLKLKNNNVNITNVLKEIKLTSTTYYRNLDKIKKYGSCERKQRKDAKYRNPKIMANIARIHTKYKRKNGIEKIAIENNIINVEKISKKTCWKAMNYMNLKTKPGEALNKNKKFPERKDTKQVRPNHMTPEKVTKLLPLQSASGDFSIISHEWFGHLHILGYIDPISDYIYDLKVYERQSHTDVLKMIKKLPKSVNIVHSDNGSEFTANVVNDYCSSNGIVQSYSEPGRSTQNRWIEYFWGRLKLESLKHENVHKLSIHEIQRILNEYKEFWNKNRRISTLDWNTPEEFLKNNNIIL